MEIKEKAQAYIVKLACDKCSGEMLPDGRCLMSNPPQYPHICNKCGYTYNTTKRYPYTVSELNDLKDTPPK